MSPSGGGTQAPNFVKLSGWFRCAARVENHRAWRTLSSSGINDREPPRKVPGKLLPPVEVSASARKGKQPLPGVVSVFVPHWVFPHVGLFKLHEDECRF